MKIKNDNVRNNTSQNVTDMSKQKKESQFGGEEKYKSIFENIHDACFELDLAGNFTYFNQSVCRILGFSREELMGMNYRQYTDEETAKKHFKAYNNVYNTGKSLEGYFWEAIRKDGTKRYIEISVSLQKDSSGKPIGFIGIGNDITQRKLSEEALLKSEEKYRELVKYAPAGIYEVDYQTNRFISLNDAICEFTGYTREELLNMNLSDLFTEESNKLMAGRLERLFTREEVSHNVEYSIRTKDGLEKWITLIPRYIYKNGELKGATGIVHDITERKQAEKKMRENEKLYRTIFENTGTATLIISVDNIITLANTEFERLSGYKKEEVENKKTWMEFIAEDDLKRMLTQRSIRMKNPDDALKSYEFRFITKAGEIRNILLFLDMIRNTKQTVCSLLDITERKRTEEKYRNIFDNAQEGIYQTTPEGRFITANQSMARILGYDSPEDLISSVADISRKLYLNPEERKNFIEMAEKKGVVKNSEIQQYRKDGSIIWVSRTMQAIRDERGKTLYYEGLIMDITERKANIERLRNALDSTVRAIASLVETRDPYTAGHQRHVGDLTSAIAAEMGLPNNQIEGLRVAAIIHDIGKISIPAEILSKPKKLTDIEFNLIKSHSQSGYDILKEIEFPWPVARMILEHHERMDGSGYPNGITGDKLLLESRILSVADTVEAMASHRPYRGSLGIELALEEIEKNKGMLYDAVVADACLRLFREKHYQLA